MKQWWEERPKGIPKSEELSIQYYDAESRLSYIITVDGSHIFKLYKVDGQKATYIKRKSNNPKKLERFISDDCLPEL